MVVWNEATIFFAFELGEMCYTEEQRDGCRGTLRGFFGGTAFQARPDRAD